MITCGYCKHYIIEFDTELENKLMEHANLLLTITNKGRRERLKKGFISWWNKWEMCVDQRFNINIDPAYKAGKLNKKVGWEYLDLLCPTMRGIKNDRA